MLFRHRHEGLWHVVAAPEGTRVFRSALAGEGMLIVPWGERDVPIFEEPSGLIVRLAEAGRYGLRLMRIEEPGPSGSPGSMP
jgi:hypothetical protein